MSRKRVYIAGPLVKGDLRDNIEQANVAFFELLRAGLAPLCPHLSCFSGPIRQFPLPVPQQQSYYAVADLLPRDTKIEDWYEMDLAWVDVSEALLRLPGEGKGSDGEVARARERGIPVFFSVEEVIEWAQAS